MPQYAYATFSSVVDVLATRLYDSTKQQWIQAELESLLIQSLRTWNALSQFWRGDFSFTLAANTWWYDLRSVSNTLIPYTVQRYDVIKEIERHLLEPANASSWTGSNQFNLTDIRGACQRRQNEVLGQTACTIVRTLYSALSALRTDLADTTIDIRRVVWMPDSTYSNTILRQSDTWAQRSFRGSNTIPNRWKQNTVPAPSFDVDVIPPVSGNYEVLYTQTGPAFTSDGSLTIPDDWAWVFQFGAMADLFSRESNASDPLRAAYCRARYLEGIALMRLMPVTLAVALNGSQISVGAVTGGDKFNPSWQAAAAGAPTTAYTFMNYLAVTPKPSGSADTVTVTVCQNAPVTGTNIQVAPDDLDTIIDYAQHLAMLKQGGQEFYQSIALYQNMQRKAANYNGKLREMGFFEMPQLDLGTLDEQRNPRFIKGSEPKPLAAE